MKYLYGLLVLLLLSSCGSENRQTQDAIATEAAATANVAGGQLYANYCAGCHGADLKGNSATALLKDTWTYGSTRGLMFRNVKFGIPGTEMGAFEALLSDDEIRQVVDYVRNSQDQEPGQDKALPAMITSRDYDIAVEQVVTEGLEVPWAIEFVSATKALVSERKGQLRWLVDGQLEPRAIAGTPPTYTATSTGGYMDIALDPDYDQNGWVYLAYSHSKGNYDQKDEPVTTKVVRGKIQDDQWLAEETLFEAPDSLWVTGGNRWGCRFLFDQAGRLLFTIGDMGRAMDAQNTGKVSGKVFRINRDGSTPADNPFVKQAGALPAIYTLGNRNVQGLAMHPETGQIWASEHGPMGGDELNILKKGANYGWPVITYGRDYSGDTVSENTEQEGMQQPVLQWTPSIAVCPIAFVDSDRFPAWRQDLLVGALAFEELRRYVIEGDRVVDSEMLLKGMGRVRDIKNAPDGSIYVVLNGPDRIIRLTEPMAH